MPTAAETLAAQIADLRRRLTALERTAQLSHSSIETAGGGALTVNDADGNAALHIGTLPDGSVGAAAVNNGSIVATAASDALMSQLQQDLEIADGSVTAAKLAADAVTTTAIADDAITTPKIVAGAIQTDQLAAASVAAGKLAAAAVEADNLAANSVTAAAVAAGSITADRLAIGSIGGNLVPDGSFESADMRAARDGQGGWHFDTGSATPRYHGSAFAIVAGDSTQFKTLYLADAFPVKAGENYAGSFAVIGIGSPNGTAGVTMEVTLQDSSKSYLAFGSVTAAASWTLKSGTVTIPANAVSARVYVQTSNHTTGSWGVDDVEIRRVVPSVEIADGAITADKLSANAITGKTIVAGDVAGANITLTGSTGVLTATGTGGKELSLDPSSINPQLTFYSQDRSNSAWINQPATSAGHATLGVNSGRYIPSDGTARSLRLWLRSDGDAGTLETIDQATQIRHGGFVSVHSNSLELGYQNANSGGGVYWAVFGNDGTVTLTANALRIHGDTQLGSNGRSLGRGLVGAGWRNGGETMTYNHDAWTTLASLSITFEAGRAFEVSYSAVYSGANAAFRIVKTVGSTTTNLCGWPANPAASGAPAVAGRQILLTNPSTTAYTATIGFQVQAVSPSTSGTVSTSTGDPLWFRVFDIGTASDWPGILDVTA